jgi:hypothetical protein
MCLSPLSLKSYHLPFPAPFLWSILWCGSVWKEQAAAEEEDQAVAVERNNRSGGGEA